MARTKDFRSYCFGSIRSSGGLSIPWLKPTREFRGGQGVYMVRVFTEPQPLKDVCSVWYLFSQLLVPFVTAGYSSYWNNVVKLCIETSL